MLPDWLQQLLHSPYLPLIIFLGAFGDAFLFTNLFILGEIFFIAGGYAIASHRNWLLLPLIWLAALLGNCASYYIGRRYGENIVRRFIKIGAKRRLNYQRAKRLIQKHGISAIITARIAGPISKFTPFIAGVLKMRAWQLSLASLCGIVIGTAQFVAMGWFLAKGLNYWQEIREFFAENILLCSVLLFCLISLACLIWRRRKAVSCETGDESAFRSHANK